MTQEEKQLLLKDLCARLPYEVKGRVYTEVTKGEYDMNGDMIFFDSPFDVILDEINSSTEEIHVVAIGNEDTVDFIEDQQVDGIPFNIDEFKPYLRSMSSMTEEEKEELNDVTIINYNEFEGCSTLFDENGFDWLNKHHFDYRGLISRNLAIEVTKENNPYK